MRLNVDSFIEGSRRLDVADIDFSAFGCKPLEEDALRCIRYMHDVEHHTICYLRDLLLTSAHRDPEITAFLTMWSAEEYWHGVALGKVLKAHGELANRERVLPMRRRLRRRDNVAPLAHLIGSAIAGERFIAIHMSWGAINEWTTQASYSQLSARCDHPVLTELLTRIMKQEGRHIDFYAWKAEQCLASSRLARQFTRMVLKSLWRPVGANVMPAEELAHLTNYLFKDHQGLSAAMRIDRQIDRLPGLEGLALLESAVSGTLKPDITRSNASRQHPESRPL